MSNYAEYKKSYDRVRLRVKRGVRFLDERIPDWRDRIDLSNFSAEDWGRCVVGQLYSGRYWADVQELSGEKLSLPAFQWSVRHGFDVPEQDPYLVLTRAWTNELTRGHGQGRDVHRVRATDQA